MSTQRFSGFSRSGGRDKLRLITLAAVLGVALFSVIVIVKFVGDSDQGTVKIQQEVVLSKNIEVVVPIRRIDAGTPLEISMFRVESRPENTLSARVVKNVTDVTGNYARSLLVEGEPLIADLISPAKPVNALTSTIPPGFRAVAISVNATSSVEGWARPGAKVDVVWASRIRGQPGVTAIVQNAKVLSAERKLDPNGAPNVQVPNTVTLLVTNDDATKIQLAQTTGALSLSLRGDADPGKGGASSSITVDDLWGGRPRDDTGRESGKISVKVRGQNGGVEEMQFDELGNRVTAPKEDTDGR